MRVAVVCCDRSGPPATAVLFAQQTYLSALRLACASNALL
ncbi:hypothetical protein MB901379_02131 [Mycobacterium basiliense]|uniref:Uncharacterized protein n=1 Tax=Mycobacterium basiliense TaxID=2094119 RepID=A0A447GDV6_9MYCO|nr:hypothetical protein MB901379_02131 [Mycobacterium basiliense]